MSRFVTVPFHGDTLFAVEREDGVHVAIKPISDRLKLDWSAQLRRTKRDPLLAQGMAMMTIPSPGGPQEATCLPLRLLPGWLFGIGANQVKPEAQEAVLSYQAECHEVLFRHFFGREGEGGTMPAEALPAREETVSVRRGLVTEARQTFGTRAAGSLWFALGLPVVPEMRGTPPDLFTYTAVRQDGPTPSRGDR